MYKQFFDDMGTKRKSNINTSRYYVLQFYLANEGENIINIIMIKY